MNVDTNDHNHNHDRDHDHRDHDHGSDGHKHRAGFLGAVGEIFHPHSHDSADSVDSALESDARGIRAVKIAFGALMLTTLLQLAVLVATGSVALLADTIHNFSDALTAVPLFIAFRLARRPPNRRYTYGYRRAEDLAGIFVIATITISAVIAGWEAIDRLIHPRPLTNIGWLFAAGVIGFAGNEVVALYRIRVGTDIGSAALVADGHHARTDGFTSLAVALGAIGVWLGFDRADPLVGLAISVAIFAVLRGAAVQVFHRLMDAVDPEITDHVAQVAGRAPGVVGVGWTQVRWIGHRLTANITITVPADLTVAGGHEVAESVRHALLREVRHLDTVDVHVDPLEAATDASPHAH